MRKPRKRTTHVYAPAGTTLAEMVKAIGSRWKIEGCFEIGKAIGLEDYEVRGFTAWYRFITLVMVVMAALAAICAATLLAAIEPPTVEGTHPLLPLTIPEVRHLLASLLWPLPRGAPLLLAWFQVATLPPESCQLFSYETPLCRRVRIGHCTISFAALRSWDFSQEKSQDRVISFFSFAERSFPHEQSLPR